MKLTRTAPKASPLTKALNAKHKAEQQLVQLNLERDTIRSHYYEQKNALRDQRKQLGDTEYYTQLNALKSAYHEQCDTTFDQIRTAKLAIEMCDSLIEAAAIS